MSRPQKTQLAALLFLAALVRLPGAFSEPFWSDEYFSWLTATQPTLIQFVLRCAGVDVYPPLAYLPAWLVARFTDAAWALRLPGALAGVATVGVLTLMLRRYLGHAQALVLGALAALHPLGAYLGWEVKAYSIFTLFNLLALDEALKMLEDPRRGGRLLALWTAASMYSFFLSPCLLAAVFAGAWWHQGGSTPRLKALGRAMGWGLAFSLPLLPFFIKTVLVYSGSSAFNTALHLATLWSLENFSIGFWMGPAASLAALLAFGAAAALALRRGASERRMLAAAALLPSLLFIAMSLATGKPSYNDRSMLMSAYAWTTLAGIGALELRGGARAALLALLFSFQLYSHASYRLAPGQRRLDYAAAFGEVAKRWQEGDAIFHAYFESGLPFQYYASRELKLGLRGAPRPNWIPEPDLGFPSSPAAQGVRALWRRFNAWLGGRGMGVYAGKDRTFVEGERLRQAEASARRLWYVEMDPAWMRHQMRQIPNAYRAGVPVERPYVKEYLLDFERRWKLKEETRTPAASVRLYERRPG